VSLFLVYLLNEFDGVGRVERLVAVDRPKHRIIHIADVHYVSFDDLAADLRREPRKICMREAKHLR
jgi:hypothetical protein